MEKHIKIFLGLPQNEFGNECSELEAFVGTLNNIYIRRNIFFELIKCEDLRRALEVEQRQEEYLDCIGEGQYFYLLFGKSAGKYAKEEFEAALEQFKANGAPKIYTYFKELPEGECPEKEVMDFMERLDKQLGHYYNMFTHLDAVKLNFMLELSQDVQVASVMEFKDGQAFLDQEPVLSLENIPLYEGNERLQQKRERQKKLDGEFVQLASELGQNPLGEGLLDKVGELGSQRKILQEEIHQMEMDMLEMCRSTAWKRHLGISLDWREKKAMELVDQGDYEGAKNILRDVQWDEEIRQSEEELELIQEVEKEKREEIRKYISGKRTLIAQIKATGLDKESVKEVTLIYENITEKAEKYQMELEVLREYAVFLYWQNRMEASLDTAKKLQKNYENHSEISAEDKINLLRIIGIIYHRKGDFQKAVQSFEASLAICQDLPEELSEKKKAESCLHMAKSLCSMEEQEKAEGLFKEALETFTRLSEKNQEDDEVYAYCGSAMDGLAVIRLETGREQEAKELLQRALEIAQKAAGKNAIYQFDVYARCNNLAAALRKMKQYEEAEQAYRRGLEIIGQMAEKNPEAYEKNLALICSNLADLLVLAEADQEKETENLYRKALAVRYRLAEKDSEFYKKDIARSCYHLAEFLNTKGRTEEANDFYRNALEIYRQLSEKDPRAYEKKVAKACYMTAYYRNNIEIKDLKPQGEELRGYLRESERLYEESLEIYSRLAEDEPERFENSEAAVCYELARSMYMNMHIEMEGSRYCQEKQEKIRIYWSEKGEKIERLCHRALEIYGGMDEKDSQDKWKIKMVFCCDMLAYLKFCEEQFEEAEALWRKSCEILKAVEEVSEKSEICEITGKMYFRLINCLYQMDRAEEADELINMLPVADK
ncbi:MAG: tetratricopeptide repeat protein [Lachnospiraceae bacterium]|nr:tetratricopeptide repeat protein [Lachnospiraceae bacterium]